MRRGWIMTVAAAIVATWIGAGCATRREPKRPADATGAASHAVRRDEQGRAYSVRTIPKAQALRVDAQHVRTNWGVTLDLAGEDATNYQYKLYEVSSYTPAPAATPSGADRSRVAASYAVHVRASNRLIFTPFGAGLPAQGQWRDG